MTVVRYRVLRKCFVNDQLYDPSSMPDPHIMAAPGLESAALKLAPEGTSPPKPDARGGFVLGGDTALAQRIADLEKQLADRDDEIVSAEAALADLQSKLDVEREGFAAAIAERDARSADLEKQIADLTAPKKK